MAKQLLIRAISDALKECKSVTFLNVEDNPGSVVLKIVLRSDELYAENIFDMRLIAMSVIDGDEYVADLIECVLKVFRGGILTSGAQ